jgi:DNA polymerase-3 subunit alpha
MEKFKILNLGEKRKLWWKQQFGADFYLEIMRHNQEDENRVNKTLIEFAQNTRLN